MTDPDAMTEQRRSASHASCRSCASSAGWRRSGWRGRSPPCARAIRELAEKEPAWFGHKLQADNSRRVPRARLSADPDAGLEDGRGFVVDVVAGHVMRELPLARRRDLPIDISALA